MDAWYKCHLAFILPIVYLSYALDCDLRRATGKQIKTGLQAVREGYGLLDALGYPILPEDTMEKLHGFKGALSYVLLRLMAKTTIGELAATDHCRNAVTELEALDTAFAALCALDTLSINWMGGALYRTKTLATGGDCCDFYICKKNSKWDREKESLS